MQKPPCRPKLRDSQQQIPSFPDSHEGLPRMGPKTRRRKPLMAACGGKTTNKKIQLLQGEGGSGEDFQHAEEGGENQDSESGAAGQHVGDGGAGTERGS